MRAAVVPSFSGPNYIEIKEVPDPTPSPSEVLVRVHAVAPAFPDLLMSQGKYQVVPPTPYIPLSDFAGVIESAPRDSDFSAGDRVAGFVNFGAAAELVAASTDEVFAIPDNLSFDVAAALPLNYMTAHFALDVRGNLKPNEWVLVHGASGGLGSATIQVACALGAKVIAVTSSDEKSQAALQNGANYTVSPEDLSRSVREITAGRGVDIIFDVVGGDITDSIRALAPLGRLLVVGFVSGEIPTVKLNRILLTNTDLRGVEWGYMIDTDQTKNQWATITSWLKDGLVKPQIRTMPGLDSIVEALRLISDRKAIGRTVLTLA